MQELLLAVARGLVEDKEPSRSRWTSPARTAPSSTT